MCAAAADALVAALRLQLGYLPLHLATKHKASEAVVLALLQAHPEGAKATDYVRLRRWPPVCACM